MMVQSILHLIVLVLVQIILFEVPFCNQTIKLLSLELSHLTTVYFNRIARFVYWDVRSSFITGIGANNIIYALALQPDGKIREILQATME
jgi:hypothetical protein